MNSEEATVFELLKGVIDPELMVNIIDLGLIVKIEKAHTHSRKKNSKQHTKNSFSFSPSLFTFFTRSPSRTAARAPPAGPPPPPPCRQRPRSRTLPTPPRREREGGP